MSSNEQSLKVVRVLLQEKRTKSEKAVEKVDKLESEIARLENILRAEQ